MVKSGRYCCVTVAVLPELFWVIIRVRRASLRLPFWVLEAQFF